MNAVDMKIYVVQALQSVIPYVHRRMELYCSSLALPV
jgi:hypothetical protein